MGLLGEKPHGATQPELVGLATGSTEGKGFYQTTQLNNML